MIDVHSTVCSAPEDAMPCHAMQCIKRAISEVDATTTDHSHTRSAVWTNAQQNHPSVLGGCKRAPRGKPCNTKDMDGKIGVEAQRSIRQT
jgi:hypothetical protein